jgi:hypothetical protein
MRQHPSERQLQQYLNSGCTLSETERVHSHVKGCVACFRKLEAYMDLDRHLGEDQLLSPAPGFSSRVMRSIQTPSAPPVHKRRIWNPEFIHTSIAGIATYLFISTGILGKLSSFDRHALGTHVQAGVSVAVQRIEHVVHWISSL